MVSEPLEAMTASKVRRGERVEKKCLLGGASWGIREGCPSPCISRGWRNPAPTLYVLQGRAGPEDLECGLRRTVTARYGGCEDSPGVLWGLELVDRRARGGLKDDTVENMVLGGEGEIHGCEV
jgi:hypothetical protein